VLPHDTENIITDFSTVWKFQDVSVIQILREINFRESRSSKTAIFGALRFINLVKKQNNAKIHKNPTSEHLHL